MDDDADEILPCPWCGGEARVALLPYLRSAQCCPRAIQCVRCEARGPVVTDGEQIELWNAAHRHGPAEALLPAVAEEIRRSERARIIALVSRDEP